MQEQRRGRRAFPRDTTGKASPGTACSSALSPLCGYPSTGPCSPAPTLPQHCNPDPAAHESTGPSLEKPCGQSAAQGCLTLVLLHGKPGRGMWDTSGQGPEPEELSVRPWLPHGAWSQPALPHAQMSRPCSLGPVQTPLCCNHAPWRTAHPIAPDPVPHTPLTRFATWPFLHFLPGIWVLGGSGDAAAGAFRDALEVEQAPAPIRQPSGTLSLPSPASPTSSWGGALAAWSHVGAAPPASCHHGPQPCLCSWPGDSSANPWEAERNPTQAPGQHGPPPHLLGLALPPRGGRDPSGPAGRDPRILLSGPPRMLPVGSQLLPQNP